MPRLSPSLLRAAHRLSPHAAVLLPVCRSIPSALSELRWIREHVDALLRRRPPREHGGPRTCEDGREELTARLCRRRGRGEPLQYILGTQPFGGVEIKCRPGVLIPRPETEAYTVYLADLILDRRLHALSSHPALSASPSSKPSRRHHPLRILDICTGTGCIPLELVSRLGDRRRQNRHPPLAIEALGLDISTAAVLLARANAAHNFSSSPTTTTTVAGPRFEVADIFWHDFVLARSLLPHTGTGTTGTDWDVVTCNPPYVSETGFARDTARSVRVYEPKAANVPPPSPHSQAADGDDEDGLRPEDVFYPRVLHVACALARARVVLLEVGDLAQARRVTRAALAMRGQRHWRRRPGGDGDDDGDPTATAPLVGEAVARVDVEIWRDWPDSSTREADDDVDYVVVDGTRIPVRGGGHGRAVLVQLDYELQD